MAIQVNLQSSDYGVPFDAAYFRIILTTIVRRDSSAKFTVILDVAGYATVPTEMGTKSISNRRYDALLSEIEAQTGDNFLAKCYAWVMAQPDMAGSIGV
jgi:hypothetical protein